MTRVPAGEHRLVCPPGKGSTPARLSARKDRLGQVLRECRDEGVEEVEVDFCIGAAGGCLLSLET